MFIGKLNLLLKYTSCNRYVFCCRCVWACILCCLNV